MSGFAALPCHFNDNILRVFGFWTVGPTEILIMQYNCVDETTVKILNRLFNNKNNK